MKKAENVKPGSLFIGRFQPFHRAHKQIVMQLVKEGKYPVIAIKDMPTGPDNPFDAVTVARNIRKELKSLGYKEGKDFEVTIIPYIDEIVVGRTPGHKLREVKLAKEFEAISGTRIREKLLADQQQPELPKNSEVKPYCIWFTGMPNAGKSTLAYELLQNRLRNCVLSTATDSGKESIRS
jgi:ribosome biogenesis GTPase A